MLHWGSLYVYRQHVIEILNSKTGKTIRDSLVHLVPECVAQTTITKKPQKLSFLVQCLKEMVNYIPLLKTDNTPEHSKSSLICPAVKQPAYFC